VPCCDLRVRGRLPLGSDEFAELGVDFGTGRGVDAAVRFAEDEFASGIAFDGPSVLVEEPVVESTKQHEILQIGGPTISPMGDVMPMNPTLVGTTDESAARIAMPELTA